MSKFAISFQDSGVKGFFAHHIEKIVLGVTVVVFGLLFATGFTATGVDPSKDAPDKMKQLVSDARSSVSRTTFSAFEEDRQAKIDHVQRVEQKINPVSDGLYGGYMLPPPIYRASKILRTDPELYPPVDVEVYAINGAMARRPFRGYVDPLQDSVAPVIKPDEEENKPIRRPKRRPRRSSGGSGAESYDEGGSDLDESYDEGDDLAGGGEFGPGLGMENQEKELSPEFISEMMQGLVYQPEGATAYGPISGVVVTSAVPMKKLRESYEEALSGAVGENPSRDVIYIYRFEAQAADVTANPDRDPADEEWKTVMWSERQEKQILTYYGGTTQTIDKADPRYLAARLSYPVPPILMKDLSTYFLNKNVPERVAETFGGTESGLPEAPDADGEPGAETYDEPGAPGSPGAPGASSGGDFTGGDLYGPGSGGSDLAGGSDYAGGIEGGYGFGEAAPADFALIRFFDFTAKPGRKYRYRIRLVFHDPNHPEAVVPTSTGGFGEGADGGVGGYSGPGVGAGALGSGAAPGAGEYGTGTNTTNAALSEFHLDDAVRARLKKQTAEDEARGATTPTTWRYSDWSEPSAVVEVESAGDQFFAGSVTPARSQTIPGTKMSVPMFEPEAKVAAVQWSNKRAVNVAAEASVQRGSLVNFKSDTDVVHPTLMRVRRLEEYHFDPNAVVLDIRGGDKLPGGDRDNPLHAPGEMLIMDGSGNLVVRNEVEDLGMYRRYLLIEDRADEMGLGGGLDGGSGGFAPGVGPGSGGDDDFYGPGESDSGGSSRGRRGRGGSES